jgi:hypothetical protein
MRRRGQPEFEVVRVRARRPILTLQSLSGDRTASPETPTASAGVAGPPCAAQGRDQSSLETSLAAPNRAVEGGSVQDRGTPPPERRPTSHPQTGGSRSEGGSGKSGLWGSVDLGHLLAEAEKHFATAAPPVPVASPPNTERRQAGRAAPPHPAPVPAPIAPDEVIPEAAAPATAEPVPDTPVPVPLEPEASDPDANELDANVQATTEVERTEPVAAETERADIEQSMAAPAPEAERPSDAELAEASRRRRAGRVRPSKQSAARPSSSKRTKPARSRRQSQGRSAAKRNGGADTHARDPLTLELPFPAAAVPSAQGQSASEAAVQPVPSSVPDGPSPNPEKHRSQDMTPEQAAEIERLMREIAWAEAEREVAVRQVVEARKTNARMRRSMIFSIVRAAGSLGVSLS